MSRGHIAIALHAHLPYVRHPEPGGAAEERWFFEAVLDTYLPLIDVLVRLLDDGIAARLTLSLSPTLTAMLRDPLLLARLEGHLGALRDLAAREVSRRRGSPLEDAALFYDGHLKRMSLLWKSLGGDLPAAFAGLEEAGAVELIGCCATHGFLPLLVSSPRAAEAQIELGLEAHRSLFGREPAGFWLPECGFSPLLLEALSREGVRYVVLDTHGLEHAQPAPTHGCHAPIVCPTGLAAFARDPSCSKSVWSATEGYPADPVYREFYRDVGFELPAEELGDLAPAPGGGALPTGLKLWRITGPTEDKAPYEPAAALRRAVAHARSFVVDRRRQVTAIGRAMSWPPCVVAPFDAELFGHWWLEGPIFLEEVFRRLADSSETLAPVTLAGHLEACGVAEEATPSFSSWGYGGYSEVWLNEQTSWAHVQAHAAARRLTAVADAHPNAEGLPRRALDQAARELLLAQSSDWTFLIHTGGAREYAQMRLEFHLGNVELLLDSVQAGCVPEQLLARLERQSPIFPAIDYRIYCSKEASRPCTRES